MRTILRTILKALALTAVVSSASAQTVSIPDPGLNAAVRAALNKPAGPLTQQDMLGLTVLNANGRNINNLTGLEAARNLNTLLLFNNHLANFSLPALTNLAALTLSGNSLTNVFLPGGMTKLFSLLLGGNPLTQITLPSDLTQLEELGLQGCQLTSFTLPPGLNGLGMLDLTSNALTNVSLPDGLTNLLLLRLSKNSLTSFTVPAGLTRLGQLHLDENQLTSFTLPSGVTNVRVLDLFSNQLTNLTLPADQQNLIELDVDDNRLTSLNLPANLTGLSFLHARANQLTNFSLPADLRGLSLLDIGENQLRHVNLPAGLGYLINLRLSGNTNLTNLTLPVGMTNLSGIFLRFDSLTNLVLPPDLNQLFTLDLLGNQLTGLTLPPDMTHLTSLILDGNPLTQLVLSEQEAANLPGAIATLENQGIPVFKYSLTVQIKKQPSLVGGAFQFEITGPPGNYTVFSSTNLTDWSVLGPSSILLGSIIITDTFAQFSPQKFYRAELQSPPANMVFIPPSTFTMGSPTKDFDSSVDERPQTTVTLTRGYWIGKYEVTQAEYLSVMGTNPSNFPGDLNRAVSSVSWFDATNYCARLTERELATGEIPSGSRYRLPTEAEWECAARAGTATQFSYGDDPTYASTTNFAWFLDLGHPDLTVHPVGQKLPNPWGLYDMHGNVWEWCQDNYGRLPGGVRTDPTGPVSTLVRDKVMRGGAYDYPNSSCRSASRLFFFPLFPDSDLGFRVVLVTE